MFHTSHWPLEYTHSSTTPVLRSEGQLDEEGEKASSLIGVHG